MNKTELLERIKNKAIDAIDEFEEIRARMPKGYTGAEPSHYNTELTRAATVACTWQEAYALAAGISYDPAAAILHDMAIRRRVVTSRRNTDLKKA